MVKLNDRFEVWPVLLAGGDDGRSLERIKLTWVEPKLKVGKLPSLLTDTLPKKLTSARMIHINFVLHLLTSFFTSGVALRGSQENIAIFRYVVNGVEPTDTKSSVIIGNGLYSRSFSNLLIFYT